MERTRHLQNLTILFTCRTVYGRYFYTPIGLTLTLAQHCHILRIKLSVAVQICLATICVGFCKLLFYVYNVLNVNCLIVIKVAYIQSLFCAKKARQ